MKPILQALLLADRVYCDKATGKHIVSGIFHHYWFKKQQAREKTVEVDGIEQTAVRLQDVIQAGSPFVYISLTDVRGKVRCILRYVNLQTDQPLFQTEFDIECSDPLTTIELAFPVPSLPRVAGVHALELLCNDEPVGSHRIVVKEISEKQDGDNHPDD